jgi:hypothetical protein
MSSPTCRLRSANMSSDGPCQSHLQRLLEEIASHDTTPTRPRADSLAFSLTGSLPYRPSASRAGSISRPHHQPSSLWVGGNSAAEDARKKLRAIDEARQRRRTSVAFDNMPTSAQLLDQQTSNDSCTETSTPIDVAQSDASWASFGDVQFGAAAATSTVDDPSPTSESPHGLMRRLQPCYCIPSD